MDGKNGDVMVVHDDVMKNESGELYICAVNRDSERTHTPFKAVSLSPYFISFQDQHLLTQFQLPSLTVAFQVRGEGCFLERGAAGVFTTHWAKDAM